MIGRGGEQFACHLRPKISRGHSEIVLACEVMKERALRHAGRRAEVIDAGCGVALGADRSDSYRQQTVFGR